MRCSRCLNYNHGRGGKPCLKCKKYRDIQIKSVRRETIKTEHIPDAILENISDPRTRTLLSILKQLPPGRSVPLMMRSVLDMSVSEIADYHQITRRAQNGRLLRAVRLLAVMMRDG
jgi:DNA-directed RNA polymerase specialized sigma24 family protein